MAYINAPGTYWTLHEERFQWALEYHHGVQKFFHGDVKRRSFLQHQIKLCIAADFVIKADDDPDWDHLALTKTGKKIGLVTWPQYVKDWKDQLDFVDSK